MLKQKNKLVRKDKKKAKSAQSSKVSTRTGIERMFKILGFLQNGDINMEPINCKTLATVLEVDRATVMRDIAFLRDRLGVEFEWDAEDNKYRLYGDTKFLPSMELSDLDKLVLEYISQIMNTLGESELACAMQESFQRLASIFTGKYPKNGWGIAAGFEQKEMASELRVYHIATRAIRVGKTITVLHKNAMDFSSNLLEIKPLGIEWKDGRWFLNAVSPCNYEPLRLCFSEILQVDIMQESTISNVVIRNDSRCETVHGGKYEFAGGNYTEINNSPQIAA